MVPGPNLSKYSKKFPFSSNLKDNDDEKGDQTTKEYVVRESSVKGDFVYHG